MSKIVIFGQIFAFFGRIFLKFSAAESFGGFCVLATTFLHDRVFPFLWMHGEEQALTACVDYDDPVVAQLITASLDTFIPQIVQTTPSKAPQLQWSSYERLDFDSILKSPHTTLCNSYIFRKALIRKHFLANTVQNWLSKHPETILRTHTPKTYLLECDYADYLDEALNEAFELRAALDESEHNKKWFILKPSMTDRGQGIRLFSTREQLEQIFEAFEDDDDDDQVDVVASQVRHFVVQEYIKEPLLLESRKKFHIRVYVVALGGIKVWVWSEMLALFASQEYSAPELEDDLQKHLTNTCLQDGTNKEDSVKRFWDLSLSEDELQGIFKQICDVVGQIFLAAASGQQMHFQVSTC
jgi:tubulin---tyrosine ligase